MSNSSKQQLSRPPEQQTIRNKCFHPSGGFVEFPQEEVETSIPRRFENIVRIFPDRVAIKNGNQIVTYSALDAMANRFAHALISESDIGEKPVGLLFEKNTEAIAAMLGVLKAGNFFVPLDPSLPTPRLTALLEDSGVKVVFSGLQSDESYKQLANEHCRFVTLQELEAYPDIATTRIDTSSDSFAFLAFTSGSTGKPKGVIQTHKNVLSAVLRHTNLFGVCPADRVALLPAWSANALQIIMVTLLNGATLLPFSVQSVGVRGLANWLAEEEITCSWMNTELFRNLCAVLSGKNSFPALRLLRVTTEFYRSDFELYRNLFAPTCIIARGYASSEASIARALLIDHNSEFTDDEIPVGYDVEGMDVSLIDENGKTVGCNTIGEILVTSRYLSPGYWRNPELTAERYKASLKGSDERVYYSGDLGLLLPDGNLVYKGRKDFQVKIRGFSVSLVEIEHALLEHSGVRQSAVVALEQHNQPKFLVAYVVPDSHSKPTSDELRRFLAEKLPDYMIPSSFMLMDSLPITNGKLDRSALPAPGRRRPPLKTPFVPPRSDLEKKIADIWSSVLAIDGIGMDDNFFDLGGHSLAASALITRLIQAFQIELPSKTFFDAPTVGEIASIIDQLQQTLATDAEIEQVLGEIEVLTDIEAVAEISPTGGK